MKMDLVCGKQVDETDSRFFSDYDDNIYHFCSSECKRSFDDHPDTYIQKQAKKDLDL